MGSSKSVSASNHDNGTTSCIGDVVGEIVRNDAGEVVKGGSSSLADTTKRVVADEVETGERARAGDGSGRGDE